MISRPYASVNPGDAPARYDSADPFGVTNDMDSATTITVGPSASGIAERLPTGYSISGTITGRDGHGVSGQVFVDADDTTQTLFGACQDAREQTQTATTGKDQLGGLPAGSYVVSAYDDSGVFAYGYYRSDAPGHFTAHHVDATPVVVGP